MNPELSKVLSLSLSEPEIGHVVCFACCQKFTLSDLCLQSLVSFISCPAPSHLKSHVTYAVNGCLEVLLVFWWLAFHPYITILVCWVLDMKDQVLCQTKHILRGLVPTRKLKTTIKACSMYCKVWQRWEQLCTLLAFILSPASWWQKNKLAID